LPGQEKSICTIRFRGTDSVEIDAVNIRITVDPKPDTRWNLSKNKDTIIFFKADTSLKIKVTAVPNIKKYNLPQYGNTEFYISATDTVQIIWLTETDIFITVKNLLAKLDSITISYKDIKEIKALESEKKIKFDNIDKNKIQTIDTIFTELNTLVNTVNEINKIDTVNNKPKNEEENSNNNNSKEKINTLKKKMITDKYEEFYKKANPLKNRLPVKDKLKDLHSTNNKLNLQKVSTLKEIFGQRQR
jgi:hypothetical protein